MSMEATLSRPNGVRSLAAFRGRVAPWLLWLSSLLLAFEVAGGIYEHVVIDLAWPSNPALVQPGEGGVNRALFWIPVHSLLSLSLLTGLWASWPRRDLRTRMAWALGIHVALRVWTAAYFIPVALAVEAGEVTSLEQFRTWVMLSPLRTVATLAALLILWRPGDSRTAPRA